MKNEKLTAVLEKTEVLIHSSIRISGSRTIYFDPYKVEGEPKDADIIFITHDHYDHLSPEDITKVMKEDTAIVVPSAISKKTRALRCGKLVTAEPGGVIEEQGIRAEAVAAYNVDKKFHPKRERWLGYVVTIDGVRVYVAGDTDANGDNEKVSCDIALVPIGGTFTFTAEEAAAFINKIKPQVAIPTHYGSIVGSPDDAERFRACVDEGIEVVIKCKRFN